MDQLRKTKGGVRTRLSLYLERRGRRLDAQSGDQGRGVSATSQQVGWGDEVRDALTREKSAGADICAQGE